MVKKAYIAPEALFLSLAVEDNTNLNPGFNDISTNLNGDEFNDIFGLFE